MSQPIISAVADDRLTLGEGPHWDAEKQCLYYVDIPNANIYKYVPASHEVTKCSLPPGKVSIVIPVAGTENQFVISWCKKLQKITWDGVSATPSSIEDLVEIETEAQFEGNKLNDGKCDPMGRLFAGTMGRDNAASDFQLNNSTFNRFDLQNKSTKRLLDGISLSNGLAWSLDLKKFYYIDTCTYCVDEFDYDAKTGDIRNRSQMFNLRKEGIKGYPDGMCIDSEGMLWVAVFEGDAQVIRINPKSRKLLKSIQLPQTEQITSVAFGGPNLDVLYVTSASSRGEAKNLNAGKLYQITGLGVKGLPGVPVKLF